MVVIDPKNWTIHPHTVLWLATDDSASTMDGRGRALDNVFVEQLWRTVKYDYATVVELEKGLDQYFTFCNYERPHQSLSYQTPAEVHLEPILARN